MRVLGVDYGSARTGLALSDPLGITCSPLGVIEEKDTERVVAKIGQTAREHQVERIVVGLPRPLSGGSNRQVEVTVEFKERLQDAVPLPVTVFDERFTSKLADSAGRRRAGHDAVAACYMLQSYLDSRTHITEDV